MKRGRTHDGARNDNINKFAAAGGRLRHIVMALAAVLLLFQCAAIWDQSPTAALSTVTVVLREQQHQEQRTETNEDVVVVQNNRSSKDVNLDDAENSSAGTSLTTASNPDKDCRSRRGEVGRWVQDWTYARRANYNVSVHGPYQSWHARTRDFRPTVDEPFPWATTWTWHDAACPVREIPSLESFCRVSWQLNLTRFLFIGDSMAVQTLVSTLSLLGRPPQGDEYSARGINDPFYLHCSFVVTGDDDQSSSTSSSSSNNDTNSIKTTQRWWSLT
jgi:hypothetical protein